MRELLSKLKIDKYHKIERFGIIFATLLSLMLIVTISISIGYKNEQGSQLNEQALFTRSFSTSLSGVNGTVHEVYTNEANTKAFLLLEFDETTKISVDANEYQMFLLGSSMDFSETDLKIEPKGTIYMFGSTGYMGVYLDSPEGFDKQILNLVIRNNKPLVSVADSVAEAAVETYGDTSFGKFDQLSIYFNPAGKEAVVSDLLNSDNPLLVSDMYEAFITRPQEMVIREQLHNELLTLKSDLDTIKEYSDRIINGNIELPDAPELIRGDSIKIVEVDSKTDSTEEADVLPDILYLQADHVVPGGFDFNWQDGSVKDGYLYDLADKANMQPLDFLEYKSTENVIDLGVEPFSTSKTEWYRSDGSVFTISSNNPNASSLDISVSNDIASLQQAWNTYYTNKTLHQKTSLKQLLMLELDVISSDATFTMNNSEDVLLY